MTFDDMIRYTSNQISVPYSSAILIDRRMTVNEQAPARVLTLPSQPGNLRNSEGDFVQLDSGPPALRVYPLRWGRRRPRPAHLAARISDDDGATWSQDDCIVLPNEAAMNVMSVSPMRPVDGRIALLYLRKESVTDCRPYLRYSEDEARTWSQSVKVIPDEDAAYYVVNNDRLIQLKTGRLVAPAALHEVQHDPPCVLTLWTRALPCVGRWRQNVATRARGRGSDRGRTACPCWCRNPVSSSCAGMDA